MGNVNSLDIEDKTTLVLSELGLNEYETRAYLTVLEIGVTVAREVSDRSAIPYAKVYQVLESLITKQLISADEGRPKKFRCRDPNEGLYNRLNILEKNFNVKHQKRKQMVKEILPEFTTIYANSKSDIEEEQGVWTIYGLANIIQRVNKIIMTTQNHIRISTDNLEFLTSKFSKILSSIIDNIQISIRSNQKSVRLKEISTVHYFCETGNSTKFVLDDKWEVSIVEAKRGKYSKGEYTAIITNIESLVQTSVIDFDLSIKIAEEIK